MVTFTQKKKYQAAATSQLANIEADDSNITDAIGSRRFKYPSRVFFRCRVTKKGNR